MMFFSSWKKRIFDYINGTSNLEKAKKKGMRVGSNFYMGSGTWLDPSHCFLISIGDNVTMSTNVHILCHDASSKRHIGYTKLGGYLLEIESLLVLTQSFCQEFILKTMQ